MVPRIAERGHSFKGAGLYYLHDKKDDKKKHTTRNTNGRVVWTHTHNIPTNDPEKAFGWMAYTAINANRLKQKANKDKPLTGRKASAGPVYSYSLAWHPEQQPDQETMKDAAMEVLELLKLQEHEAVFVAHNDVAHPHVHVICNLVHPEHGRTASPSYDYLTASRWAEKSERQEGKIRCEQRVVNNQKRRMQAGQERELALVKHREEKLDNAQKIRHLYTQYNDGEAFQVALETAGYTLARGDRRGFVLVDQKGKIISLSRQLKGLSYKTVKSRLEHIGPLPSAKDLSEKRQSIKEANYKKDSLPLAANANIANDTTEPEIAKKEAVKKSPEPPVTDTHAYLKKLDTLRAWEQKTQREKDKLLSDQQQYKRQELLDQIQGLEQQIANSKGIVFKVSGKRKSAEGELEALRKNLANIDQRIAEQHAALDRKALEHKPDNTANKDVADELQKRIDYIRDKTEERKRSNERDKGRNLGR